MDANKKYKNLRTGTTFDVGTHNTVIKKVGQPPKTIETQWARRNKNQ